MTRRLFAASALAASAANAAPATGMGIAATSYMTVRRFKDTLEFFDHCKALGAGGIQTALSSLEPDYLRTLRRRADDSGMYIELMAGLPRQDSTLFERVLQAAVDLGALCVRASCGGRRYEDFQDMAARRAFEQQATAAIARAVPIAERKRMPLALENHKDWTLDEHVDLLRRYSSEYFGACLDTGNNIALLDDPMEVVERLAPFAFSTHIKDMGVQEYGDGFLLSEVALGEGLLDMKRIAGIVRRARPKTRFTLEMITRNPLRVPCLKDSYWITFPQRPATYLARTLRMVRERQAKSLPSMDGLDRAGQLRLEDEHVRRCLSYARDQMGI